ncbi:hypothetical protein [Candidatus Nitrosocosmicus sp. SS]|jgi:hypothetical protein|uniref:hypothetical protein n=1 Tax=Candidatus Nitrosocosmicus agrestis TaxID=2563600 RepID=UPI00122DD167|nr:hypothetical protein [Candidatus Nitrosocosmicus sp. SS]KAA2280238.1 hypothetical protein F1Z66_11590 [Candidatus Nitrosocosmicus sp. SS]KAF0869505.1 hypothetical protein E5N71_04555 [Candidatus Nitrosocosmicus sp. SS]
MMVQIIPPKNGRIVFECENYYFYHDDFVKIYDANGIEYFPMEVSDEFSITELIVKRIGGLMASRTVDSDTTNRSIAAKKWGIDIGVSGNRKKESTRELPRDVESIIEESLANKERLAILFNNIDKYDVNYLNDLSKKLLIISRKPEWKIIILLAFGEDAFQKNFDKIGNLGDSVYNPKTETVKLIPQLYAGLNNEERDLFATYESFELFIALSRGSENDLRYLYSQVINLRLIKIDVAEINILSTLIQNR